MAGSVCVGEPWEDELSGRYAGGVSAGYRPSPNYVPDPHSYLNAGASVARRYRRLQPLHTVFLAVVAAGMTTSAPRPA